MRLFNTMIFAVCLVFPTHSDAQNLALDFVGDNHNGFQSNLTLGWSFEVTHPIRVHSLAFFDHFQSDEDGLAHEHLVRIWTDDPNPDLLASSLITNESKPVSSTATNGRWMHNEVVPIVLLPGHYIIGADDPPCAGTICDRFRMIAVEATIPEITFGEARSASPPGPPQSSQPQISGGYFGPSLVADAIVLGDANGDGKVDLLDVAPFVDLLLSGDYVAEADTNLDGFVDLLDVQSFADLLAEG